jgi:hypothetical protein
MHNMFWAETTSIDTISSEILLEIFSWLDVKLNLHDLPCGGNEYAHRRTDILMASVIHVTRRFEWMNE